MRDLLSEFRAAVAAHAEALYDSGDDAKTNALSDRVLAILSELIASGQDAALFNLYSDPDPWVQKSAASFTLELDEKRALAKLQELATTRYGHTRTMAQLIIQEWMSGNLSFRKARKDSKLADSAVTDKPEEGGRNRGSEGDNLAKSP